MLRLALSAVAAACLTSVSVQAQEEAEPFSIQGTATALAGEANRAFEAEDWEAARRALESALALKPQHPAYLGGLVQVGLHSGDENLIFDALERLAAAGIAYDRSRLGDADESLRAMQPDRYAALDAARKMVEKGHAHFRRWNVHPLASHVIDLANQCHAMQVVPLFTSRPEDFGLVDGFDGRLQLADRFYL